MAEPRELSLALRAFLAAYRWHASLRRPLGDCRVALVSSAGLVAPGDEPFDDGVRGGDWSFRLIPSDADLAALEEHHRSDSFSHAGIEADRNLALPLHRLHELAAEGAIGAVAPRHISLMGSITAPGRLRRETLPAVADLLAADGVDVALMVPV